jgi:hypothetical protein
VYISHHRLYVVTSPSFDNPTEYINELYLIGSTSSINVSSLSDSLYNDGLNRSEFLSWLDSNGMTMLVRNEVRKDINGFKDDKTSYIELEGLHENAYDHYYILGCASNSGVNDYIHVCSLKDVTKYIDKYDSGIP